MSNWELVDWSSKGSFVCQVRVDGISSQHRGQMVDYAIRVRSQALVQRLGYLADLLELPLEESARTRLLDAIGKSTPYLGRPSQWGTGGEYDATWRIVDNVPSQELMAEIEVR